MFKVTFHRVGYAPEQINVYSLEEASAAVTAYQDKHGMGASDCDIHHGEVRRVGKQGISHSVSYNGRVWDLHPVGGGPYVSVAYDPFASQEDTVG